MKLSEFDYHLPPELIAIEPAKRRDQSRLLVLDKKTGAINHKIFSDLINYLEPGDVLVLNNSKVIPARLLGYKVIEQFRAESRGGNFTNQEHGATIEIFLSKHIDGPSAQLGASASTWECLVKGRIKDGQRVKFASDLVATIIKHQNDATCLVEFNLSGSEFFKAVEEVGQVPLPPYIVKSRKLKVKSLELETDRQDYQTVFADEARPGSVAAPTAGLHFTPELLDRIKAKGIKVEYLTLHVGLGTFLPVKTENIEEHQIHSEWTEVPQKTIETIVEAKRNNKKIVAVGTTTARTLEFFANFQFLISNFPARHDSLSGVSSRQTNLKSQFSNANQISLIEIINAAKQTPKLEIGNLDFDIPSLSGWVDIFIYPPYRFKIVDALVTNFHLPKSTLLMLVSALATKENIDCAYQEAIKEKYRFYSYGDAMLIM